jgi:Family of unknown function (DUF6077)
VAHRLRTIEAYIVLLSAGSLILLGPLRSVFVSVPLIPILATLLLFVVPGAALLRWFFGDRIFGAMALPISFALSMSIFAFLGVPFLLLHLSLASYLWVAGGILAASLAAVVVRIIRRGGDVESAKHDPEGASFDWLWVPFLSMCAVLAFNSWANPPPPNSDIWVYLADVRELFSADKLAWHDPYFGNAIGTSRLLINGWLLEQAAFAKVSGVDPVVLVPDYLTPILVVMSLLAFYSLARILLESETGALLSSSLYALVILGLFTPMDIDIYLVSRIAEDKMVSWFLFLPVTLVWAFLFLKSGELRYLAVFAFLCWAAVAVHPVGLAMIGLSTAGFGLLHLATDLRSKGAWTRTVGLGIALLSVLVAPALYVLTTGESLATVLKSADISYGDPRVLANMVFVRPEWKDRILELGGQYYMVGPSPRLLAPVILVAFLEGLPFLLWRLKRSLAAQLLAGTLLVPTVVCFVPPIATFFGDHVVLPGQMWRLAWPIPLAALLIIGWMVWEVTRYAQVGLDKSGITPRVARLLPLMLVCALIAMTASVATGQTKAAYKAVSRAGKGVHTPRKCFDPVFRWMQTNIKEPSVMLAPDAENTCIPAYTAQVNVVSVRDGPMLRLLPALNRRVPGRIEVPQGTLDVQNFFNGIIRNEARRIIVRQKVDYVMVRAGSNLDNRLERWPGFSAIDTPGSTYSLYGVDRQKLGGRNSGA